MVRRLVAIAAISAAGATFIALGGVVRETGPAVALAQYGGTPVNVGAAGCILVGGGHRSVPAGSTIVIRSGWVSGNRGAVRSFLAAQMTILSVNDGRMIDVSDRYGEPEPNPLGAAVSLAYPTGVTLVGPGDSMRFTFALLLRRTLVDIADVDGDGSIDPNPTGAGLTFGGTCTVTAS